MPPFEFIEESPDPDTSIANLEIYTIYTGDFGEIDPDLDSIASTTGGSSFAAPNPEDLVNTLLTIIELPPTNNSPIANDDAATTQTGIPLSLLSIDLLLNDEDADGDVLIIESVANPVNGNVEINDDNIIFTPDALFAGNASFEYTISDGNGGTDTAIVNVTVESTNTNLAPSDIQLDNLNISENEAIGTVVGTFSSVDLDGNTLFTYTLVNGNGDKDNSSFTIEGNELKTAESFDFETQNVTPFSLKLMIVMVVLLPKI